MKLIKKLLCEKYILEEAKKRQLLSDDDKHWISEEQLMVLLDRGAKVIVHKKGPSLNCVEIVHKGIVFTSSKQSPFNHPALD